MEEKQQYSLQNEQLTVTIIPMKKDESPFIVKFPYDGSYISLRQIFLGDEDAWRQIYQDYSPVEPPGFSVYRKMYANDIQLHILFLKCEGYRFPRNPNAYPLELFCKTHFYGPLAVVFNKAETKRDNSNAILHEKQCELLDFHPKFLTNILKKSCANNQPRPMQKEDELVKSYDVKANKIPLTFKTLTETFNHSLEQQQEILDVHTFQMFRYKTTWCPIKDFKHDQCKCLYAHRRIDFRRPVDIFKQNHEDCPNLANDGFCYNNQNCKFCHQNFERLYHPIRYKTQPCDKFFKSENNQCKRGEACAFYHGNEDKRSYESNLIIGLDLFKDPYLSEDKDYKNALENVIYKTIESDFNIWNENLAINNTNSLFSENDMKKLINKPPGFESKSNIQYTNSKQSEKIIKNNINQKYENIISNMSELWSDKSKNDQKDKNIFYNKNV